ncbi:MAG TPA: protoporphyrinogen oxidase [Candidatus Saccharimonadales bacterium]|nr:protoporphyrinogen oxidase [Candidatus Saccharimonadales bacterium]
MRIAIIGGGISGLSAAYYLEQERAAGAPVEYSLFESSDRLGGVMFSDKVGDCVVEGGPDSFLTEKPWANQLCAELGIANDLIGSNDSQRITYILVKGQLIPMPDGLMFMVPTKLIPTALTRLFSWSTKFKMLGELLHPPRPVGKDETVAQMVERHFGSEVVDRLADPLLSGVYGGDAASLSVRAVLPKFVEMEENYGSLCRAMLAGRKKMAAMQKAKGYSPKPLFSSLKGGMQQMIDAIVARLNPQSIRTSTAVGQLTQKDGGWELITPRGPEHFDSVIFATPARIASTMLAAIDAQLSEDLGKVEYSSSVTVTLGYEREQLKKCPPGFGFLIPRSEGTRMLATTFVHTKFPFRAPDNKALVRCFLGGANDQGVLKLSDEEITNVVRKELKKIAGLEAEPWFVKVYRWDRSMAQYTPGHLERIERIGATLKQMKNLSIAGNFYKGIGVPDCIRTGKEAAQHMATLAREGQTVRA